MYVSDEHSRAFGSHKCMNKFQHSVKTRAGPQHERNEDHFYCADSSPFFIVCDGVGRYKGAHIASEIVTTTAAQYLSDNWHHTKDQRATLQKLVRVVRLALKQGAEDLKKFRSMATTMTLLAFKEETAWLVHIGDSRAYRFRDRQLEQLSDDHSLAWEQYKCGAISKSDLRTHPNQKLLTRSLNARSKLAIADIRAYERQASDCYLLCSDGLNKELDDPAICDVLEQVSDIDSAAQTLLDLSMNSDDDVTVLLVRS
jgi:PPM family protein phosphatase